MTGKHKIWRIPKPNPVLQEIISSKLGLSKIAAQILINRGITTVDEARDFLSEQADMFYDPLLMKDMSAAVERISMAIGNGEKIRVFGDYDVDGITGTTVLMKVLKGLGADVDYYIPERLTEGYGMNMHAVLKAHHDGISLVVTVDSGISALDEVEYANRLGVDVVITDHHEPSHQIPAALAVINPKQKDCNYPFKDLAGVGVALKLAQALLRHAPESQPEDLLTALIELVCVGTVADIVPLKGENRALVKKGLGILGQTRSAGLRALMEHCGIGPGPLSVRQLAFQMAPRINAAGRLGDAALGVRLLLTDSEEEASSLAAELCALNEERQGIEAEIYKEALQAIESGDIDLQREKVIVMAGEGWHLGVIGIVASKLVQDFHRPVVLLSIEGETAKGSARSIPAFNIFDAFQHNDSHLTRYGGHRQAAGLTMQADRITLFREDINRYADQALKEEDLLPEIHIDISVELDQLDCRLLKHLEMMGPYGCDNPEPVLAARGITVPEYRAVGSDGSHLKFRVRDGRKVQEAIGFNLGQYKEILAGERFFDLVFTLEMNEWNGRESLQLNVKDFRPSSWCAGTTGPDAEIPDADSVFIEELFNKAPVYLTDDYYRNIGDKEEFYSKVAGVTYDDRQTVAAGLAAGERLDLVREPGNPHDSNAVKVETGEGIQVGYLNARLAGHFAPLLDKGESYSAYVSQVTGGSDRNYGVNIIIRKVSGALPGEGLEQVPDLRERLSGLPYNELRERVRETLLGGYSYREKQVEAMEHVLLGHNTLAIFGTGRGKSAVFQSVAALKALGNREMTVIVYPLRALVNDQFDSMSARLGRLGLRVYKGNGSISDTEKVLLFDALNKGGLDVLLTTPEFVACHMEKIRNTDRKTGLFVVDESHHIGLASQAHRPVYKRLKGLVQDLGNPPVMAVTATADDEVAGEIISVLDIEKVVIDPHVRQNLQLIDKRDWPDKNGYLRNVVGSGEKTIIYVNSRLQTVELAAMLRETLPGMNSQVVFYHAGLNSEQRNTIERMFRNGTVTSVVSTSAFGEGIDIPDVKHIVVFHLNFNFTEFNQQCGRCGRDGSPAKIHLLCGRRDAAINRFILDASSPDRDTLARLYVILREMSFKLHPITSTNDEIAGLLKKAGVKFARPNLVSSGLGILEEMELIQRESLGRYRHIYLLPAPEEKIGTDRSIRFMEGQEEKRALKEFEDYFFDAAVEELLQCINRPIYPAGYLEHQASPPLQGNL
ncbi:MAG: single-stranded-DNA-specific exonuclease RecJ [Firmicutes bacterium HGW-Firmicutes-14]|nr:MAG: single-stranded-DNA-specific exonuclease RecJ [Firmicutes bacterium HGW-Firmicutes-14]